MAQNLIRTILSRRSIRKYLDKEIRDDDVKTMLEAAMAAPSASNRKPWHFIIVTERERLNRLAEAHPYGKMLREAPLCISVCGDETISPKHWIQDCSAATENILLAATAIGLGAVWLGVYPQEDRIEAIADQLSLPKTIIPLNLISVGYPDEEKDPRTQYDDLKVHYEHW